MISYVDRKKEVARERLPEMIPRDVLVSLSQIRNRAASTGNYGTANNVTLIVLDANQKEIGRIVTHNANDPGETWIEPPPGTTKDDTPS